MSKFRDKRSGKEPSQRQLKVGEEIRHALSWLLSRGELADPRIDDAAVTVSEVRISPDLKNATAYAMPLGGYNKELVLEALNERSGTVRRLLGSRIHLRYTPKITFRLDHSFENASRINELLSSPHVAQDLYDNNDSDDN